MRSLKKSFKYAFNGLAFCFKTQKNMVIHAMAGLLVLALAWWLGISTTEKLFLLMAIFLVIILETINTALEKAVDVATRDFNHVAHIAKDVAAGAVLLGAFFAVIVGLLVMGPPLLEFLIGKW